jgi:glycosyltransferase involved in cell wall biosynthesis
MKKRYLVISHNYWPALGGAEKLLQSIAESLKREGQDVEVLTSNAKNCNMYFSRNPELVGKKREMINGILVQREDIRNISQKIGKLIWGMAGRGKKKMHNIGPLLLGPYFSKFVFKYIFSKKYTHIICGPFPTSVPFFGYLLKKIHPKTKLIIDPSLHVDDPMHTGRVLRFLARRADAILVRTGEETKLLNSWGINSRKIFEIGIGIDEKLLKDSVDDEKNGGSLPASGYILYMGQQVSHKNILVLKRCEKSGRKDIRQECSLRAPGPTIRKRSTNISKAWIRKSENSFFASMILTNHSRKN